MTLIEVPYKPSCDVHGPFTRAQMAFVLCYWPHWVTIGCAACAAAVEAEMHELNEDYLRVQREAALGMDSGMRR